MFDIFSSLSLNLTIILCKLLIIFIIITYFNYIFLTICSFFIFFYHLLCWSKHILASQVIILLHTSIIGFLVSLLSFLLGEFGIQMFSFKCIITSLSLYYFITVIK